MPITSQRWNFGRNITRAGRGQRCMKNCRLFLYILDDDGSDNVDIDDHDVENCDKCDDDVGGDTGDRDDYDDDDDNDDDDVSEKNYYQVEARA